jgi:hypothetical protein
VQGKAGYEYCYLYAALNPYTGPLFSLILLDRIKGSFGLFTHHFSHYLDELHAQDPADGVHHEQRSKVLLIADGTGAHLITILQKYYQNPQVIMQLTLFPYINLPT